MKTSEHGVSELARREGRRNYAYPDPASPLGKATASKPWGKVSAESILYSLNEQVRRLDPHPWTVGIGVTGPHVTQATHWSDETVDKEFALELRVREKRLNALLEGATTSQNQFDAFMSLMYNIGEGSFAKSTALRQHKAGNYAAAANAITLFNMARGRVHYGLVNRRAEEKTQYLTPDTPSVADHIVIDTAPTADPERTLAKSEINIASGVAAATATASAMGEFMDVIEGKALAFAFVIIAALAGYIIYQRVRQRREGWA